MIPCGLPIPPFRAPRPNFTKHFATVNTRQTRRPFASGSSHALQTPFLRSLGVDRKIAENPDIMSDNGEFNEAENGEEGGNAQPGAPTPLTALEVCPPSCSLGPTTHMVILFLGDQRHHEARCSIDHRWGLQHSRVGCLYPAPTPGADQGNLGGQGGQGSC
jgi:hypothetical protein